MKTSASRRLVRLIPVAALPLLAAVVRADEPAGNAAEVEALLDRLEARAEQVHSLVMNTKLIKRSPTEDHTSRKKTWLLRKGDTLLMRTEGRTKVTEKWMDPHQTALTKELMVVDGTYKWGQLEVYDEIRVTRQKASPQAPLAALREACRQGRSRILEPEVLLDRPCAVIEIQRGQDQRITTMTFWIAEAYGAILKMVKVDPRGGRTEMVATSLYVNQEADQSLFRYDPPEGVKVQDLDAVRGGSPDRAAETAATQPAND